MIKQTLNRSTLWAKCKPSKAAHGPRHTSSTPRCSHPHFHTQAWSFPDKLSASQRIWTNPNKKKLRTINTNLTAVCITECCCVSLAWKRFPVCDAAIHPHCPLPFLTPTLSHTAILVRAAHVTAKAAMPENFPTPETCLLLHLHSYGWGRTRTRQTSLVERVSRRRRAPIALHGGQQKPGDDSPRHDGSEQTKGGGASASDIKTKSHL